MKKCVRSRGIQMGASRWLQARWGGLCGLAVGKVPSVALVHQRLSARCPLVSAVSPKSPGHLVPHSLPAPELPPNLVTQLLPSLSSLRAATLRSQTFHLRADQDVGDGSRGAAEGVTQCAWDSFTEQCFEG